MPRRPGRKRFARGLTIPERGDIMRLKATEAKKAGDIWEIGFVAGTRNWEYWQRILSPFLNSISTDAELTPQQKMFANYLYLKRLPVVLSATMGQLAVKVKADAKTYVMPIPVPAVVPT